MQMCCYISEIILTKKKKSFSSTCRLVQEYLLNDLLKLMGFISLPNLSHGKNKTNEKCSTWTKTNNGKTTKEKMKIRVIF